MYDGFVYPSGAAGLVHEFRPERVIVLQVDAWVGDADEYAPDELPDQIAVNSRGGTDFRPCFHLLDEHDARLAVCLYFTDLEYGRYPEAEPGYPVLW